MEKDSWDKAHIFGGILGGVLVPVAIFAAGVLVSSADRHAASVNAEAERLTDLIVHLADDDPSHQRIAIEIAEIMQEKGQLPDELSLTLARITANTPYSDTSRKGTELLADIQTKSDNPSVIEAISTGLVADSNTVSPRVYFHISLEAQRFDAEALERNLQNRLTEFSVVVPGIERIAGPKISELRYFKSEEAAIGQKIADTLKELGVAVKLSNLSELYPNAKIRPFHYELWLSPTAFDQ